MRLPTRRRWRSPTRWSPRAGARSSQPELHADFHDDVDRNALAYRRRELPLAHCVNRPFVEPGAESLKQVHVADRSVAADHDFHHDFARETAPTCIFCVIRFDFSNHLRRRDAAAGTIGAAAEPAATSGADAGAIALAEPGASTGARAASTSRAAAVV